MELPEEILGNGNGVFLVIFRQAKVSKWDVMVGRTVWVRWLGWLGLVGLVWWVGIECVVGQEPGAAGGQVLVLDEEMLKQIPPREFARLGKEMYEKADYYIASELLEYALRRNPTDYETAFLAGMAYYKSRDYRNAARWFYHVAKNAGKDYPEAWYYYALMLIYQGQYTRARGILQEFQKVHLRALKMKSYNAYRKYGALAESALATCEYALAHGRDKPVAKVVHLDTQVNTAYTELSPMPQSDTLLVYASLRSDTIIILKKKSEKREHRYRIRFYASRRIKDDRFEFLGEWRKDFNEGALHVANGAFSPDGKRFYFTKCARNDTGYYKCDIYVSEYDEERDIWTIPRKLPPPINDPHYTATQPTVGEMRRGSAVVEVLYFVSDRKLPGHRGGYDIWYSYYMRGRWSPPRNLGKNINTPGDEMTPWYDVETQTLYFSSNGHPGFGGLDIFKAQGYANKWTVPQNLGKPINSSYDDLYFVLGPERYYGYFTSNRPGVIALKHPTCCDDIFYFEWLGKPRLYVRLVAYDETDPERKPLDSVEFRVSFIDTITGRLVQIANVRTGEKTYAIQRVYENNQYKFTAVRRGYFSNAKWFSPPPTKKHDTFLVMIPLKPLVMHKPYVLRNIYYDFDKWTLRPESYPVLDSLVQLLKENPELKVEIRSHTDSIGSDEYNLWLSQKRAESVVRYLISKGISPDRLIAKGYGERFPIAPNSINGRDNPEGRAKNRRTEFVVIGKINIKYEDEIYQMLEGDNSGSSEKTEDSSSSSSESTQQPQQ